MPYRTALFAVRHGLRCRTACEGYNRQSDRNMALLMVGCCTATPRGAVRLLHPHSCGKEGF
ncbi:MAG: hypothetical protein IJV22_07205 [Bacteroidales bacterium]|nr:hypothetical protein [Bacteroidales bacterium]